MIAVSRVCSISRVKRIDYIGVESEDFINECLEFFKEEIDKHASREMADAIKNAMMKNSRPEEDVFECLGIGGYYV